MSLYYTGFSIEIAVTLQVFAVLLTTVRVVTLFPNGLTGYSADVLLVQLNGL